MLAERQAESKPRPTRRLVALLAMMLGIGISIGLIVWTGAEGVLAAFRATGAGVAGVCALRALALVGAGIGWLMLFPPGMRPPLSTCVLIRFLREGANALLPMTQIGGEIIGARALSLRGIPASLCAASVVVDVLVQAATQFLFAILGLAMLAATGRGGSVGETLAIVVLVALPALCGFYLVQRPPAQRTVKALLARLVGEPQWLSFGALDALYSRLSAIYANRRGVSLAAAIHMTVWLFGALEVRLVLACMGLKANYPEALIIESLMQAVRGAAFAIPGALGAQEGGLVAICAIFGISAEAAIAMSLVKRVPDLVFGLPSLVGWQFLEGHSLLARGAGEAERSGE
jgi:putative membrane protein